MFKHSINIILVFITSAFTSLIYTQKVDGYTYSYYNFSKVDGFSEVNVTDFVQDSRGFIYAGTGSGLYRHNGNRWEHIKSPIDKPSESIGTFVSILQYDIINDLIYIVSLNDCQTYNPKTGNFKRIKRNKNFNEAVKLGIFSDQHTGSLISSSNGIWKVENDSIVPWTISASWSDKFKGNVYNIVRIDDRYLGVCAKDHFGIYDVKKDQVREFQNHTGVISRKGIYDKKRHRIWFISLPKLVYFDLNKNTFGVDVRSTYSNECRDIALVNEDQLWISSGMFFDINNGKWTSIPYTEGKFTNALQYWASLFIDQEKNQWCGSIGFGANVLFHTNKWNRNIYLGNELINYEPYSYAADNNHVYISNGSNNMVTKIHVESGSSIEISMPVKGPVFGLNLVKNHLYGCNFREVFLYDLKTKKSKLIPLTNREKTGDLEYLLHFDNKIYAGNNRELLVQNLTNNTSYFVDLSSKPIGIYLNTFTDTVDQAIYILGLQNIAKFDIKTQKVSYPFFDNTTQLLKTPNPVSMARLGKDLWMTSKSDGLFKIDPKTYRFQQLTKEKHFFSSNFLNHIMPQKDLLWIGSVESLHLFDTKEERVIMSIDRQHGFKRDDTSYGITKAGNKIVKFNYASIDIMHPNMAGNIISQKPIYIIHCFINGQEKSPVPFAHDTTFIMNEKDANIELEYSLPIYTNYQHHSFSYRLSGIDTSWTHTYDRSIKYNRLPVGKYTLEIKAWTSNGIKINHSRKIHFIVKPLFYKTFWFLSLIALFLTGGIFLIYKFRLDKVKTELTLKSKYEQQISVLEMKALRAQMNPHFIFNSLNSIQKFIFEKDEYAASQYLTKFSRLIRLILDQSNQEFISVNNEIEMLKYYIDMERLRFDDKFSYDITKSPEVPDTWMIPSMVIQPHIENAIWHGLMHKDGDCRLLITFTNDEAGILKVVVEDNGVGRAKAEEMKSKQSLRKKSFGSFISRDRIHYFSEITGKRGSSSTEDLYDDVGNATGTRIVLLLTVLEQT